MSAQEILDGQYLIAVWFPIAVEPVDQVRFIGPDSVSSHLLAAAFFFAPSLKTLKQFLHRIGCRHKVQILVVAATTCKVFVNENSQFLKGIVVVCTTFNLLL
jgi:hypothetical protein